MWGLLKKKSTLYVCVSYSLLKWETLNTFFLFDRSKFWTSGTIFVVFVNRSLFFLYLFSDFCISWWTIYAACEKLLTCSLFTGPYHVSSHHNLIITSNNFITFFHSRIYSYGRTIFSSTRHVLHADDRNTNRNL